MGLRGELNIMSDQCFDTNRKAEDAISMGKQLNEKANKDDINKLNMRFKDFVPFYEYNDLLKRIDTFALDTELSKFKLINI
jgi:hypothetical protein